MEILRVPSQAIEANLVVTSPLTAYEYTIVDLADSSNTVGTVTSNSDSEVTVPLPSDYDGSYSLLIDDQEVFIDVVRPYVDPTTKGESASEIAEYKKHEELARAIIDSVIEEGFYFQKKVIQTTGLGSDYIPLWINATKVLKLYENNVLMYDADFPADYPTAYQITSDKTAIVESYGDLINRLEGAQLVMPTGGSDLLDVKYSYRGFPRTFDYTIVVAAGYQKLPSDIVRATELLVDDIACGKLDYYQRYIKSYNTDQFKIQFDDTRVFEGTGNILVDKILSKYAKSIRSVGVL